MMYEDLFEMQWARFHNLPFVTKFKFENDGYIILVSELSQLYGEKLSGSEVQERFSVLNPYVQMKPNVIVYHLNGAIEYSLNDDDPDLKITQSKDDITIRLRFSAHKVSFFYDLKLELLPSDKFITHLTAPTMITALWIQEENMVLKQKIKDLEKKELTASTQAPCIQQENTILMQNVTDFIEMKDATSTNVYEEIKRKATHDSLIKKKGKVMLPDLVPAFMYLQDSIQNCLFDGKAEKEKIVGKIPSVWAPISEELFNDLYGGRQYTYRDLKKQNEPSTSNAPQQPETPVLPLKREIEDISSAEGMSLPAAQPKKIKGFKF